MASSPLGEPRVPKPSNQGGAKKMAARPPVRGHNGQRSGGMGRNATGSIKSPGSGTNGRGTKNHPSVT